MFPPLVKNRIMWEEVTSVLQDARQHMKTGEMLTEESFRLDTSMNALELMHPRMDPGMSRREGPTVRERVQSGDIPIDLATEDVSKTIDAMIQAMVRAGHALSCPPRNGGSWKRQSLACHYDGRANLPLQISFHDGNSLPETVFSCVFAQPEVLQTLRHRIGAPLVNHVVLPEEIYVKFPDTKPSEDGEQANVVPRTYSRVPHTERPLNELPAGSSSRRIDPIAVSPPIPRPGSRAHTRSLVLCAAVTASLKLTEVCRRLLLVADLYEEEDLSTMRYGLDMAHDVSESYTLALLLDAERAVLASDPTEREEESLHDDRREGSPHGFSSSLRKRSSGRTTSSSLDDAPRSVRELWDERAKPPLFLDWAPLRPRSAHSGLRAGAVDASGFSLPPGFAPTEAGPTSWRSAVDLLAVSYPASLRTFPAAQPEDHTLSPTGADDAHGSAGEQAGFLGDSTEPLAEDPEEASALSRAWVARLRALRGNLVGHFWMREAAEALGEWSQVPHPGSREAEETQAALRGLAMDALAEAGQAFHATLGFVATIAETSPFQLDSPSETARSYADVSFVEPERSIQQDRRGGRESLDGLAEASVAAAPGFDRQLHRNQLVGNQPRYTPPLPVPEILQTWQRHCRHLASLTSVLDAAVWDPMRRPTGKASGKASVPISLESIEQAVWAEEGRGAAAAAKSDGQRWRRHVNLSGLWALAERLTHANANCCVRSRLLMLLCPPLGRATNMATRLLGTHSFEEVVRGELLGRGVPMSILQAEEPFRFCQLAARAIPHLLKLWCMTPLRRRRRLDGPLSDWCVVHEEAIVTDRFVAMGRAGDIVTDDTLDPYSQERWDTLHSRLSTAKGGGAAGGGSRRATKSATAPAPEDPDGVQCLTNWTLDVLSRLMSDYLWLGCPLGLYGDEEYWTLYWYSHYLCRCQETSLTRREAGRSKVAAQREQEAKRNRATNAKKRGRKEKNRPAFSMDAPPARGALLDRARQVICQGIFRVVAAMHRVGAYVILPAESYSTPKGRFLQRFDWFQRMRDPKPLMYEQFEDASRTDGVDTAGLFSSAQASFQRAKAICQEAIALFPEWLTAEDGAAENGWDKAMLERVPIVEGRLDWCVSETTAGEFRDLVRAERAEAERLLRVAVRSTLECMKAGRLVAKEENSAFHAHFDFADHPYFPVCSLTEGTS